MPISAVTQPKPFTRTLAGFTTEADVGTEIPLGDAYKFMAITVENSGANALTAFLLQVKSSPTDAAYTTLLATTGWDTAAVRLIDKTGTLKTLAGGATGLALINVSGLYSVKFRASAGTATTLTVTGQMVI